MEHKYLNAALTEDFLKSIALVFCDYRNEIDSMKLEIGEDDRIEALLAIFSRYTEAYFDAKQRPILHQILSLLLADETLHCELDLTEPEAFEELQYSFDFGEDEEFPL